MSHSLRDQHHAAHTGAAISRRPERTFVRVSGRAPAQMLSGLLAGRIPSDPVELADNWWQGLAPCSAMLTPKGRMITDMRVLRAEPGEAGTLLLDLPSRGVAGAVDHFGRYLPPRMARVDQPVSDIVRLSVVGPAAAELLSAALDLPGPRVSLIDLEEDEEVVRRNDAESGLHIVRSGELGAIGYDVVGTPGTIQELADRLVQAGATTADPSLVELLRIERGRPAFGVELDEDTMPGEAGILERCVDTAKGCFTGQEVVVRIRDRGHVNRHIRGLILGEPVESVPAPLYDAEEGRPVGELRSVARHPTASCAIGLAYVRRELEPPCLVRVGSPSGPTAQVRSLGPDGWRFEKGDASFYP